MAITLTQQKQNASNSTNSTSLVTTLTGTPANGALLLAEFQIQGTTPTDNALTGAVGTGASAWSRDKQITTNRVCELWSGVSNASGAAVTATYSKTSNQRQLYVNEWAGADTTASRLDVTSSNSGSSANPATGTATTTNAGDVVTAIFGGGNSLSSGPTNGFANFTQTVTGGANGFAAYKIETGIEGANTDWTMTAGITWSAVLASYFPSGGAPSRTALNTRSAPLGMEIGMDWRSGP